MRIFGKGRYHIALLAVAVLAGAGSEASAWSYGSWGSYGSAGAYGSAGSYGYDSYGSYGSGGSWGCHGRLGIIGRIRARRAARWAAYGSYGSYACYGSYGAYSVSYGSSGSYGGYGSAGSSGSYGGVSYAAPVAAAGCVDCTTSTTTDKALQDSDSAVIEVTVPAEAIVYVNDKQTSSTGATRSYVSNNLKAGQTYVYQFRVEYLHDGQPVVKNESVKLSAGDRVAVSFGGNESEQLSSAAPDTKTEVKLTVPEQAKVYLAGSATDQTGTERSYVTHRLAEGETWDGYTVRVELEVNGETQVREETLAIEGGQTYELAFDFDTAADQLAAK